ncbi:DUF4352 domain-containing protein [Catelliglobosispora koreensis]|uniref:hypothetical protein n=1 Tax=Catelliglobosispora koreensis TaxID=129052 RepID=UPI0012F972C8|nr:hypothetical protein [Catelliglobosispora koreensis]
MTRRESITWWGSGAVLLLFAVSGLIGALVKPAEAAKPWQVSVLSASTATDRPPLQRADAANRWLIVRAKVEVTGDSSASGLSSMVRLSGVDGLVKPEPGVVLLRDSTQIDRLHPGMPEEVVFAWEQAAATASPQQLTVQISGAQPVTVAVTAP